MDTAFVIGNGESRNIFPIEELKDKGVIYGCNAIFRDYPDLCDHIVAVNDPMYNELSEWHKETTPNLKIHGPNDKKTMSLEQSTLHNLEELDVRQC